MIPIELLLILIANGFDEDGFMDSSITSHEKAVIHIALHCWETCNEHGLENIHYTKKGFLKIMAETIKIQNKNPRVFDAYCSFLKTLGHETVDKLHGFILSRSHQKILRATIAPSFPTNKRRGL